MVRLSMADGTGTIGHIGLYIRGGASVAQGRAALNILRSVLPTVCTPSYGTFRREVIELNPGEGHGIAQRQGVFIFETTNPEQFAVISIPGVREDMISIDDNWTLDIENPAINAVISGLQSGPWSNPFGYTLTNCIAMLVQWR